MADYVILGLVKRRAELSGEAEALNGRIAQVAKEMGQLDAVIRQFDPGYNVSGIKPKRPRVMDKAKRGEMSRAVLGALREASAPLPVVTIARRLMEARGLDVADVKRARQIGKRVAMALRHQEKQGTVESQVVKGKPTLWSIRLGVG